MVKCLQCNTKFHSCSNCSIDYSWEYGFCSKGCWEKSSEYIDTIEKFKNFINSLDEKQKEYVKELIDDVNVDEYVFDFLKILKGKNT